MARRENKFIAQTDWCSELSYVFPEQLLTFNEDRKRETIKFIKESGLFETFQDYTMIMRTIAKILSDFEMNDMLDSEVAKAVLANYEFLKEVIKERFPEYYSQFEEKRREVLERLEKQTQLEQLKEDVRCPRCGSNQIVSNGKTRWLCNSCSKQFQKRRVT